MLAMGVKLAVLADTINLIDEDDRRFVLCGLPEKLSHPFRADADEYLRKIASMRAEKLCVGFASDCLGQHRLACSRRADEEHALGQAAAKALELPGIAQKIHYLLNLSFRFLNSRH